MNTKKLTWPMVAILAICLVVLAANALDLPKAIKVKSAISDICAGKNIGEARTTLQMANDRQYVLDQVKEALADDGTVLCKTNLLQTLTPQSLNQPRVINRALDSESLSTRRAACAMLYGNEDLKARCGEIAIAWLADESADERHRAAMICGQLKLEAARPALLAVLDHEPTTMAERQLMQHALGALRGAKVEGLSERLLAMVRNPDLDETVRGDLLQTLETYDETPRDQLAELAIGLLTDTDGSTFLRSKAAFALRRIKMPEAWAALESVLLSPTDSDLVLKRNCLKALSDSAPIDRIRQLLTDKRVYASPYFGTRIDVCTGLAALNVREPIALDILISYLTDDDPQDTERVVRSEAYLSLWVLTGVAYGIDEREHFKFQPRPIPNPDAAREYIAGRRSFLRPSVTKNQAGSVEKMVKGDESGALMERIRQYYADDVKRMTIDRWREAEKAKQPKDDKPEPQGPQKDD